MRVVRKHRVLATAVAVGLFLLITGLVGLAGCGAGSETSTTYAAATVTGEYGEAVPTTAAAYVESTAAPATTVWADGAGHGAAYSPSDVATVTPGLGNEATAARAGTGQKIISDAQVVIEVESGKFQMVFDQALLLADRYGGYLVSSNSQASGADNTMKSGTVAIRVPSNMFTQALNDASKLGNLKNESLSTQDVTQEYVDLQARIKNSQAHVDSLVALLAKAKTIDEILQVQSVLTNAQQELEQLEGRQRYLDEHTNYSTLTMSIYEKGTEPVVASTGWGVGKAFKDALHYLVRVFNGIVKALGVIIPVVIVLAIIAYIVYRVVRAVSRRNRERQQKLYQPSQQYGWRQPVAAGPVGPQGPAGLEAQPVSSVRAEPAAPLQPETGAKPEEKTE